MLNHQNPSWRDFKNSEMYANFTACTHPIAKPALSHVIVRHPAGRGVEDRQHG